MRGTEEAEAVDIIIRAVSTRIIMCTFSTHMDIMDIHNRGRQYTARYVPHHEHYGINGTGKGTGDDNGDLNWRRGASETKGAEEVAGVLVEDSRRVETA